MQISRHSDASKTEMTIAIFAEKYDDLLGQEPVKFAHRAAAELGFPIRGMANQPTPYPVNQNKEATDKVAIGLEPIGGYEIEYRLVRV